METTLTIEEVISTYSWRPATEDDLTALEGAPVSRILNNVEDTVFLFENGQALRSFSQSPGESASVLHISDGASV